MQKGHFIFNVQYLLISIIQVDQLKRFDILYVFDKTIHIRP